MLLSENNRVFEKQVLQSNMLKFMLRFSLLVAVGLLLRQGTVSANHTTNDLRIVPITAYNFVVDSNVLSPSTYAPTSATIGAQFCNDGANPLTDVTAYVGDFNQGTNSGTPGVYPQRATDGGGAFDTQHPHLDGTPGYYSFIHQGGSIGLSDAARFIGTIQPGQCITQYWLISYPRRSNLATANDNLGGVAITGGIKPDDDLWLQYDFWASADNAGTPIVDDLTRTAYMRNEISASANKIWPNGDNKVPDQYLQAITEAFGWNTVTPRRRQCGFSRRNGCC